MEDELIPDDDDKRLYSAKDVAKVFEMRLEALIAHNALHIDQDPFLRGIWFLFLRNQSSLLRAAHRVAMRLVLDRYKLQQ
jgi:hypothetical protein